MSNPKEFQPVSNPGASPMYVGSIMIPPGETRLVRVPEQPVVVAKPAAPAAAGDRAPPEALARILAAPLEDIVEVLRRAPPEGLDQVEAAEKAGQGRAEVLQAVAAERSRRENEIAVLALLDQSIPSITAAIQARDDEGSPKISDEQLELLLQAEEKGKTRKGVTTAIAEEQLRRAAERGANTDPDMDAFAELVKSMDNEELNNQVELHQGSPAHLAVIENEINARKAG